MNENTKPNLLIREAYSAEDPIIAEHFYQLWMDNALLPENLLPNWEASVLQFIEQARRDLKYCAFVAELDGKVVGSAGCQLFAGLYPLVFVEEYRQYGYLWGVYVEPSYRRQGIASQLAIAAVNYLKSLNCTRVILHASPSGKPVYASLGFVESNEMRLDL